MYVCSQIHIHRASQDELRNAREVAPGLRGAPGIPTDQVATTDPDTDVSGAAGIDLSRPEKKVHI